MATRMNDSDEQGGVRLDCCTIQPFRLTGNSHSLAEKWKRWQRSFNLYVCSKGYKDDLQKKACYCIAPDRRCKTCIILW